jgi:hypothetical protein
MMNFNYGRYNDSTFRKIADGIASMIGIPNPEIGKVFLALGILAFLAIFPAYYAALVWMAYKSVVSAFAGDWAQMAGYALILFFVAYFVRPKISFTSKS